MNFNNAPSRPIHPDAKDLLTLVNNPGLLEIYDEAGIRNTLLNAGYRAENSGNVTMGWGRKVGEKGSATAALLVSKDNKVLLLSVGGHGTFNLNVLIRDSNAEKPNENEMTLLERFEKENFLGILPSEKFHEAWGKLKERKAQQAPNQVQGNQKGFLQKIFNRLSGW